MILFSFITYPLKTGFISLLQDYNPGRREKEILELIKNGFTNLQMAEKLNISVNTVDTYRKSLLAKLKAKNTADLVRLAFLQKLINLD